MEGPGNLTRADLDVILESLSFSQQRIRDYMYADDANLRAEQLHKLETVSTKVRALRKAASD
jgi:hypothetical protein